MSHAPTAVFDPAQYRAHVAAFDNKSFAKNALLPFAVLFLVMLVIGGLLDVVAGLVLGSGSDEELVTPAGLVGMIGQVVIGAFVLAKLSKVTLADHGFVRRNAVKQWLIGAAGGIVAVTIVWGANMLLGGIDFSTTLTAGGVGTLALAVAFFLFQGPFEELIMRSYLMPNINAVSTPIVAMVVSSVVFMLLHGFNPNMTAMGWLNLFVFGMVFAALYYRTGSIWLVGAAHTTWNLFLGNFWGSHVSGNLMPGSAFQSLPRAGSDLLSGGVYGMEGSIVATIIGLLVLTWALRGAPSVPTRIPRRPVTDEAAVQEQPVTV